MSKYIPYPFYHDDVPIDISFVFEEEKPAGKHGFLKTEGKDFVFEDGTRARFWGTNFNGSGCFPEHEYAEKLARRLSKIGVNMVRLHQLDAEWHTPNLFSFTKGKRVTGGKLHPESMDRLDYLIYCLKKEGIYCYMDMFTYRRFKSDEGVENAEALTDAAKPYCIFDDRLIALQKELCKNIWIHENSYTGLAYCDDPVFVMAEIVNECDLFTESQSLITEPYRTEFVEKLDAWLKENKVDKKADAFDLKDYRDETLIAFKMYLQEKYYDIMQTYMRECGVKIPITGNNWIRTPANMKCQNMTDYKDAHPYFYDWRWGEFVKCCANKAITEQKHSYLLGCTAAAGADHPTFISEWDMPWPNEYRAESPIYNAAIGMLQGWSGFAIHTYSYSARLERMCMLGKEISAEKIGGTPYRQGIFSTWNDPAKFGLFYHASLITRRGDVSCARNTFEVHPLSHREWNWKDAERWFEISRVVTDYSAEDDGMKAAAGETIADSEKNGCAEASSCSEEKDYVLSDTGEIYRNWKKNYGYVDTPMTKCVYGFLGKNGCLALDGVKIECSTDFAVLAMSSLTEDGICMSDNILLTAVGRAQNTDAKFECDLMLDYGKPPVLIEAIEAEIEIETEVTGLKVWAVSPEGYYIGKEPTVYEDGKIRFTIGRESKSMYYLIVKE